MLTGPVLIPKNDAVTSAVVFLHGYGSNGDDLIGLAPYMAHALPNTAFFSPNAPQPTNMGMGYQWFDDNNYTFIDRNGIGEAKELIEDYITNEIVKEYGIPFENVAIVSFSQGTMTSLFAAPRFKKKLAGIVAYSGKILWQEELAGTEYHKLPITIIHGEADDIVPYEESVKSYKELKELGFNDISLHTIEGLSHGIDEEAMALAERFLVKVLEK